jgi:hypothetical protein
MENLTESVNTCVCSSCPYCFCFFGESLLQGLLDTALDGLPLGLFLPTTVISAIVGAETPPSTGHGIRIAQGSSSG